MLLLHTNMRSSIQLVDAFPITIPQMLQMQCDADTRAHAQRLAQLANLLGRRLALSEDEQNVLYYAALFHDIGKAGIPATILHKPGPLNATEREIMHRHPVIGQQLLLQVGDPFARLAPIVVAHHEHWDGHGYPDGLAGETIPLLARILAVLDAYDAMTSQRCYGRPLTEREACHELERCAAYQFDPYIVEQFLAVLHTNILLPEPCLPSMMPLAGIIRQNRVASAPVLVGATFVTPLLQSAEYAPASA